MNRLYPSDRDAAEAVGGIPEDELRARDEERERELRHAEFVAWLKKQYMEDGAIWRFVVQDVSFEMAEATRFGRVEIRDFIASDGAPVLFAALSRAMREVEVERENLLDRR